MAWASSRQVAGLGGEERNTEGNRPLEERIDIEVAGQLVEGRVFFSVNNITVQITYLFAGVTLDSHLPYFSLTFFRFESHGRLTPYGRQSAKELLTDLYDACSFCEANEETLLWKCQKVL